MTDSTESRLARLVRPRLLSTAARRGVDLYRRERDLRRILRNAPGEGDVGTRLLDAELRMEEARKTGDATYSIGAHIEMLTAILAEIRPSRLPQPATVTPIGAAAGLRSVVAAPPETAKAA